jgi:hypothetical protein
MAVARRSRDVGAENRKNGDGPSAAAEREAVEKTSEKDREEELKQFCSVTSTTSSGSANSMSTHCIWVGELFLAVVSVLARGGGGREREGKVR